MADASWIRDTTVFPLDTTVNEKNHLVIGGCDAANLVAEFGSPLYVFDERTLREQCRGFVQAFASRYPHTRVIYAAKAYLNLALARILREEGLGLDVVSGGELAIARAAGFPMEQVYFHGNNKLPQELSEALAAGLGRYVVDNFHELELLNRLAGERGQRASVLLRLSPGIDPHTGHSHTTTGILDSKFGFPISTGQAADALRQAQAARHLDLVGLHAHLGSPIFEREPYAQGIEALLEFAARMRDEHGLELREFSPGGGFAVQYVRESPAPTPGEYAETIVPTLQQGLARLGLPEPLLVIEPGRAIVARAGVALYTVGARKEIPELRTYVSVDGGMSDNIRPAIYGSRYEAVVANRVDSDQQEVVTIAGKYCESGDILIKDIALPPLQAGDILAIPASGAYCLSMASNYNAALRPPIVLVRPGWARLIRRRETYQDLMSTDSDLVEAPVRTSPPGRHPEDTRP